MNCKLIQLVIQERADDPNLSDATDRGYLSFAFVNLSDGRWIQMTFYSVVQFCQTVEDDLGEAGWFAEQEVVILKRVNVDEIKHALNKIAQSDYFAKRMAFDNFLIANNDLVISLI